MSLESKVTAEPAITAVSFLIFIVLILGIAPSIFAPAVSALPPPPPAAPSIPSFTYNTTNNTPIVNTTTNMTVNTTVNTTINDSINTTANDTVNDTANDNNPSALGNSGDDEEYVEEYYDDEYVSEPPSNNILAGSIIPASEDDNIDIPVVGQQDNASPISSPAPGSSGGSMDNDTATEGYLPGSGSNGGQGTGTGSDDPKAINPLSESPLKLGNTEYLKEVVLSSMKSTLGIASLVVTVILLILFVVLNRNHRSPAPKDRMVVHPPMSLSQQMQQMPTYQMPPRVGPTGPQSQRLQLRYQKMLLERKKFVNYQRYLHKFQRERMMNAQNREQSASNLGQNNLGRQQYQYPGQQQSQDSILRPKI